ncbi:hypothetical protein SAMN04489731_104467 [Amycolatopsis regifaucium]|nr:hypothetical protein SAMN04489731_104467 [Amycolatopsis regifaucium]
MIGTRRPTVQPWANGATDRQVVGVPRATAGKEAILVFNRG